MAEDETHSDGAGAAPRSYRQRLADKAWALRSMIALAVAAVILGGVGGAAIAQAGDGGDQGSGFGPGGGPGGFGQNGPGGRQGGRQGAPRGFGQGPTNPSS